MVQLVKIADWTESKRGSVIFVHGLGGHPYDTWRQSAEDDAFWPLWLAQDLEGLSVYSLSYAAPPSNWLGTSMSLQERAVNVLALLLSDEALIDAPISFVCHSLGGLVVKQVLREADDQSDRQKEAGRFLDNVNGVVFLATPHTGSAHATLLDIFRLVFWPSKATKDQVNHSPVLRKLNVWFRNWSADRKMKHLVFYETQDTAAGTIVNPSSSDPGLAGVVAVPIDADHTEICKISNREALVYQLTYQFVADTLTKPRTNKRSGKQAARRKDKLSKNDLPEIKVRQNPNITPILVRLAVLLAIGFVAFKGIGSIFWPSGSSGSVERLPSETPGINIPGTVTQTGTGNVIGSGNRLRLERSKTKSTPDPKPTPER